MAIEILGCGVQRETLCKNILNSDEKIEVVALLNNKGKPVELIEKNSLFFNELTEQQKEMLFMQCVLQNSMNSEYDHEFGKTRYSIIEREEVLISFLPIIEYVVMVISKLPSNPFALKNKILQSCI